MCFHLALHEDGALLRVQAASDIERRQFTGLAMKFLWVLGNGDGVHIHDAEEVLLLALFRHPAPDCTEIVANVQLSRRLYAGEHTHFAFDGCTVHVLSLR